MRGEVPRAELAAFFEDAFHQAAAQAQEAGLEIVGPPFGFYPGCRTRTVEVEAGFPVPARRSSRRGPSPRPSRRPRRRAIHVGPYDTMERSHGELVAWMSEQGLEPAAQVWETYLSDPESHPDPSTWQTRIVWPVG
ncbi:hypothetical protein GCM10023066_56190 [Nocardioides kongjuensis]